MAAEIELNKQEPKSGLSRIPLLIKKGLERALGKKEKPYIHIDENSDYFLKSINEYSIELMKNYSSGSAPEKPFYYGSRLDLIENRARTILSKKHESELSSSQKEQVQMSKNLLEAEYISGSDYNEFKLRRQVFKLEIEKGFLKEQRENSQGFSHEVDKYCTELNDIEYKTTSQELQEYIKKKESTPSARFQNFNALPLNEIEHITAFENMEDFWREAKYSDGSSNGYEWSKRMAPHTLEIDELAMVHTTKYLPKKGYIQTSKEAGAKLSRDGVEYKNPRNTIHFAINGLVSDHLYGSWADCPYIIIEPLKHHVPQVKSFTLCDTYTVGGVKLSKDSVILVPKEDINKAKSHCPDSKVVSFEGDRKEAAAMMLYKMGYMPHSVGMWGWSDDGWNWTSKAAELAQKHDWVTAFHSYSEEGELEDRLSERNYRVARSEINAAPELFDIYADMQTRKAHGHGIPRSYEDWQSSRKDFVDWYNGIIEDMNLNPDELKGLVNGYLKEKLGIGIDEFVKKTSILLLSKYGIR